MPKTSFTVTVKYGPRTELDVTCYPMGNNKQMKFKIFNMGE